MEYHTLAARGDASPIFMITANVPPYTNPNLTANLVVRVVLGVIANLVCLVPLRLLYRNGEFAAVVFIIVVEIKNIFTIVMALIWRNDNMESWWPGYGLCDIQQHVYNGCAGIYVTCLLAIMRNLAHQVGILRANPLTLREKRRRNLIQALIIFPLPIVQLTFTWPLAAQRYMVGTLMGCNWVPAPTWPFLVFFIIAELAISVVAAIYAVIVFFRFRQVSKVTSSALTTNRAAYLRSQRAKRRLYLMVMSILVPFLPITVTLCVLNVQSLGGVVQPFNFNEIHHSTTSPIPWAAIIFVPSRLIDFGSFNNGYISILTAIPIFLFFGMTKDAMNSYRLILVWFGLGKIWPSLYTEYDPDRKAMQASTSGGVFTRSAGKTKSSQTSSRFKINTQTTIKSTSSGDSTNGSSNHNLARMVTPHLASSLGDEPASGDAATMPPPVHWSNRLPRNPFPFLSKSGPVHLASSSAPQPPVLPALSTKTSVFSLHSQGDDDDIFLQPVTSRRQRPAQAAATFSPPAVAAGQPHPSEALDIGNAFSTLDSSSRSVKFADRVSSEAGDYYHAR